MLLAPALASLLCLAHAGAGPGFGMPMLLAPEPDAAELANAELALELFEARRFAEAATIFEALWRDTGSPRFIFNAAVARERLGHEAVAYVHLRRFLAAPGLAPEERSSGELRLKDLQVRTSPLRITLTPPPAPGTDGVLVLELADKRDRPPIELDTATFMAPDRPGVVELYVEAGVWRVRADLPDAKPAESQVAVVYPEPGELSLGIEAELVTVEIAIGPAEAIAAGATVQLTPEAGGEALEIAGAQASNRVEVAPGSYAMSVSAPDFVSETQSVVIGPGVSPMRIQLRSVPPPPTGPYEGEQEDPEKRVRLGLAIASGTVGAGLLTGGAILVARGRKDGTTAGDAFNAATDKAQIEAELDNMLGAARRTSNGDLLLGAGVGAGVAGVTVGAGGKEGALFTEGGVGLVMLGAGIPWLIHAARCYERETPEDVAKEDVPGWVTYCRARETAPSLVTGAGAGMLSGAVLGLVSRAILRRRGKTSPRTHIGAAVDQTGASLSLSGRF